VQQAARDYDYITQTDGSYFGVFIGKKYRFRVAFDTLSGKWLKDVVFPLEPEENTAQNPGWISGILRNLTS
jgi:hypothetical protein